MTSFVHCIIVVQLFFKDVLTKLQLPLNLELFSKNKQERQISQITCKCYISPIMSRQVREQQDINHELLY